MKRGERVDANVKVESAAIECEGVRGRESRKSVV